ncbi:hypothetical protein [Streptomyces sp. NPDC020965]|uniref:hypothetical protein n=1 Tax=Streptomyces sp. NPDC020965 TaxID=3365105 RepID=UPI0037B68730
MIRYRFAMLAAATLGLSALTAPAQAAPDTQAPPSGCTTSVEWVREGNHYYRGRGNIQCDTGSYTAKNVCRNLQTGKGYVVYGTEVVNAPGVATVTCNTGNVAESVHAVESPPVGGVSGCVSWIEWVHEGSHHYYGRGNVQCDTGRYQAKTLCHNLQTGQGYVVYGTEVVNAPGVATATCNRGNRAQSVHAVPQ